MRFARAALSVALTVLLGAPARADDEELTLRLELGPVGLRSAGYGSETRQDARDATGTAVGGLAGVTASYGLSNLVALDVGFGALVGSTLKIPNQTQPPQITDPFNEERNDLAFRGTIGATFRLGTRLAPTLSIFTGYQRHILTNVTQRNDRGQDITVNPVSALGVNELIVGAALGISYRLGATWSVAIDVRFVHAFASGGQSFDSVEAPLSVGVSWYPRRFSSDVMPGGGPLTE